MQLVINTFGAFLRRDGERFLIKAGERELGVSAHKVQSILITTGAGLSTDALRLAAEHNIDVVFFDRHGDPYGRFWQNRMGSTAAIRRRQLEASDGPDGLEFVRGWIETKLRNQQEFLEELARRRPGSAADFDSPLATLGDCRTQLAGLTGTVDEQRASIMGLEGAAGRVYFACLGKLVPEPYRFTGRSRHPATDGCNAMLNYCYGVLYSLVERACICAGLDPFVGFLHTDNYGKKSLVFDLLEPFRILGDRTALLLFTGRRAKTDYFEPVPGGVALTAAGRAALLESFNERLDQAVRYPVRSKPGKTRNIKRRDILRFEAHSLANRLLGRTDMPRVVETRQLWDEDPAAEAVPEDEDVVEPGLEEEGSERETGADEGP
ncbi:MAG TPA: CRISPR-associated endonuclease Cas1 [Gemmataceae bacterium]|nr:CRISPR-associated endonuclease Cas1 [Gemmataceae bacterium]